MQVGTDVTRLLEAWREGDAGAGDRLFALVYDDLRALARRQLARLTPGQTLAPTALVHEAYLRFSDRSAPHAINRQHFFGIAARAMRHIVIDHVRRTCAKKRGGGVRVPLESGAIAAPDGSALDLLALDEALAALERLDARQASVVELRFFAGLELAEIASALETSERTVKRDWQKARAFLSMALRP
jgi:RNA polymerase sigma-70 factor (ECF subfamily)